VFEIMRTRSTAAGGSNPGNVSKVLFEEDEIVVGATAIEKL
jgi:hypothetical protein